MIIKKNKLGFSLFNLGIQGYMIIIFFNGILKHYGLLFNSLEKIRPYLPELFLFILFIGWCLLNTKIYRGDLTIIWWLSVVSCLGIFKMPSFLSFLSTFRDLFEPFILLLLISTLKINNKDYDKIFKKMIYIYYLFVIIGFIYAIYQKNEGSLWTARYFAGYEFWGVDPKAGIRISSGSFGFKVLGTTASAETFGFYNMLFIALVISLKRGRIINKILIIISLFNIYLSGMKTALLISIVLIYLVIMKKLRLRMGVFFKLQIMILIVLIFYYMSFVMVDWQSSSFYQRILLWRTLMNGENLLNLFLPINVFYYSAKSGNTGIISFWDNSYLYLAYSIGLIGLSFVIKYFYSIFYKTKKFYNSILNPNCLIIITILLSSVSTCIFVGRNYISLAIIIISLNYSLIRNKEG